MGSLLWSSAQGLGSLRPESPGGLAAPSMQPFSMPDVTSQSSEMRPGYLIPSRPLDSVGYIDGGNHGSEPEFPLSHGVNDCRCKQAGFSDCPVCRPDLYLPTGSRSYGSESVDADIGFDGFPMIGVDKSVDDTVNYMRTAGTEAPRDAIDLSTYRGNGIYQRMDWLAIPDEHKEMFFENIQERENEFWGNLTEAQIQVAREEISDRMNSVCPKVKAHRNDIAKRLLTVNSLVSEEFSALIIDAPFSITSKPTTFSLFEQDMLFRDQISDCNRVESAPKESCPIELSTEVQRYNKKKPRISKKIIDVYICSKRRVASFFTSVRAKLSG